MPINPQRARVKAGANAFKKAASELVTAIYEISVNSLNVTLDEQRTAESLKKMVIDLIGESDTAVDQLLEILLKG